MIDGILDKKKRKYSDGCTFAALQKRWRSQQRNGKLTKDKRFSNRWTWFQYRKNHCDIVKDHL